MKILLATAAAGVALLALYLALGGGSYEPEDVANPCDPRPLVTAPEGLDEQVQQLALSALDGAACELRVTREDLLAALADPEARQDLLDETQMSDEELEAAVKAGLDRAYDNAVDAGRLEGLEATLIGQAIELVPVSVIVDIAQSETAQDAAAALGQAAGDGEVELDAADDLFD
jgi:hypothetical protein